MPQKDMLPLIFRRSELSSPMNIKDIGSHAVLVQFSLLP